MPFQTVNLNAIERATLNPVLIAPAETLKKRLDLASPRTLRRNNPLSPRLEAPLRQLQSNLLRVRVSKLLTERPAPKHTIVSPRLARVSKVLEMQRKKDVVSRTLTHREPQEPPKLAFSLQSLARQLSNKMLRDKVSHQLSPALLRKRSVVEDTSLDSINETLTDDLAIPEVFSLSPKLVDFTTTTPKKNTPASTVHVEAVPCLEQVVDEAGWEVVSRKPRKKKQAALAAAPKQQKSRGKKGSNKKRGQKKQRNGVQAKRQPRRQQVVEQKRSGVYPSTDTANKELEIRPWFPSLSLAEREAHNRSCALRRIVKKEQQTRMMLLRKMREREATVAV